MGVLQLWGLLEDAREKCSLESLSGKTLAVDLSGWICEASALKATSGVVAKPYLRTLFFRVAQLYHLNIRLVFVCDGNAISLKQDTVARRINERRGVTSAAAKSRQTTGAKKQMCKRPQLRRHINECCQLLTALGIPTVLANGEAEALCALLSHTGVVDGCITDDNDAFLYGANTVYRGFSVNTKGTSELSVYTAATIESVTGLNRDNLVALALLLGCDYLPQGVPGIGSANAMKFLQAAHGNILAKLVRWASSDPGEPPTNTEELRVYRKIRQGHNQFLFKEVITEYLHPSEQIPSQQLEWHRPSIKQVLAFLAEQLDWPLAYAKEKVFPLLTHWDLCHGSAHPALLHPLSIAKKRVRHGVACFEITWCGDEAQRPEDPATDSNQDTADEGRQWMTTIEDAELVAQTFPSLVAAFEELQKAKLSKRTRTKVKRHDCPTSSGQVSTQKESSLMSSSEKESGRQPVASSNKVCRPKRGDWQPLTVSNPFRITSAERELVALQRRPLLSGYLGRTNSPLGKPPMPVAELFPVLTLELESDEDLNDVRTEKSSTIEKFGNVSSYAKDTKEVCEGLLPLVERLKLKRERRNSPAVVESCQTSCPDMVATVCALPECVHNTSYCNETNFLSDCLADLSLEDDYSNGEVQCAMEKLQSPRVDLRFIHFCDSDLHIENKTRPSEERSPSANAKLLQQESEGKQKCKENETSENLSKKESRETQQDVADKEEHHEISFGNDTALLASLADCSLEERTPSGTARSSLLTPVCDRADMSTAFQAELQLLLSLGNDSILWSPAQLPKQPNEPAQPGTGGKPIIIT